MIMRYLASIFYAVLLVSLSGVTQLAYALSCSDIVDQASGTTYSKALGTFLYINGKTYAISRSAATGSTSLPDSYFAFSPNISRDYQFDGVDVSSLKKQLSGGQYGVARPVTIKDLETQTFILKNYGKRLLSADGTNGTLINAWKEYGAADFSDLSGGALAYTNWQSIPTITQPPAAVAMGSDGKWFPVASGQKLSQIVEFDGKMDCATDMTPVPSPPITPSTDSGIVGYGSSSALKDVICGGDLNQNGNIVEAGEVGYCLGTAQGQLCTVAAVDCKSSSGADTCDGGYKYDYPVYIVPGDEPGVLQTASNYCDGRDADSNCYHYSQAQAVGYVAPTAFLGSIPVYVVPGSESGVLQTASNYCYHRDSDFNCYLYSQAQLVGYVAPIAFLGSIPVYNIPGSESGVLQTASNYCDSRDADFNCYHYSQAQLVGYVAPTAGVFGGTCVCPTGSEFSCMANPDAGGKFQCSPYPCEKTGIGADNLGQIMNGSFFQNDGQKDPDGNCLGTVYIFGGRPSRCRPPGLTVGELINCCASGSEVITEDLGNNIAATITALKYIYNIGQIAYGTYLATQGAEGMIAAGEFATSQGPLVSDAIAASMEATASGAEAGVAFSEGIGAFTSGLVTSPAFIAGVVIFVAMKILLGGCDAGDIQTTMARDSNMCHQVGYYCERRYKMIGCVQNAKGFCCYNSILAKIMAEQGRPQLPVFGTDGGWGDASSPNCRGFTPEEFQALDFNKIDLSEYYSVVENNLGTNGQNAQQNMTDSIQQRFQNMSPTTN